jgi:hypothetical protein
MSWWMKRKYWMLLLALHGLADADWGQLQPMSSSRLEAGVACMAHSMALKGQAFVLAYLLLD